MEDEEIEKLDNPRPIKENLANMGMMLMIFIVIFGSLIWITSTLNNNRSHQPITMNFQISSTNKL